VRHHRTPCNTALTGQKTPLSWSWAILSRLHGTGRRKRLLVSTWSRSMPFTQVGPLGFRCVDGVGDRNVTAEEPPSARWRRGFLHSGTAFGMAEPRRIHLAGLCDVSWPCRVVVFFLISATRYRGRSRRVTARPRPSAHALLTHAGRSHLRRSGRLWAGRGGGAYSSHRNRRYLRRRQIKHIVPERRDQQAHSQRRGNSGGRSASGRARRQRAADPGWEAGAEQFQDAKS